MIAAQLLGNRTILERIHILYIYVYIYIYTLLYLCRNSKLHPNKTAPGITAWLFIPRILQSAQLAVQLSSSASPSGNTEAKLEWWVQ